MVFENLAYDGKTQPRTLGARRDIGLGEPVAVLRRQGTESRFAMRTEIASTAFFSTFVRP
jgi:hypothetical protein